MITFETSVRIGRPLADVYAYVTDPGNFPHWNSAVETMRKTSAGDATGVGSTYAMERTLPTGKALNELEVIALEPTANFAIRTTSGPTPFLYQFRFEPDGDATIVRLRGQAELGSLANVFGRLARRALQRGVDDNLAALKTILENTP